MVIYFIVLKSKTYLKLILFTVMLIGNPRSKQTSVKFTNLTLTVTIRTISAKLIPWWYIWLFLNLKLQKLILFTLMPRAATVQANIIWSSQIFLFIRTISAKLISWWYILLFLNLKLIQKLILFTVMLIGKPRSKQTLVKFTNLHVLIVTLRNQ